MWQTGVQWPCKFFFFDGPFLPSYVLFTRWIRERNPVYLENLPSSEVSEPISVSLFPGVSLQRTWIQLILCWFMTRTLLNVRFVAKVWCTASRWNAACFHFPPRHSDARYNPRVEIKDYESRESGGKPVIESQGWNKIWLSRGRHFYIPATL